MTEEERIQNCTARILAWYPGVRRPLPWREAPTPYEVWVSEIMLQQTRIEAVRPYYARFLRELPDVRALAEVSEERLLKLWEGLGYYSRARNLQKAARQIMADCGGELPRTAAELKKLPGIGDYTAGAVASIAYGEPEPAVDGNVLRLLSRVLASGEDVLLPRTRARMTALLRAAYPRGEAAGLLTEGLMELGETVCVPNSEARCESCPLASLCLARESGRPEAYPVRTPPRPRRIEQRTVLLLRCGGRWAIRKREEKGLLARMWELPNIEGRLSAAEAAEAVRALGGELLSCENCGEARHVFTHVEWHMTGWLLELAAECPGFVWESAADIRATRSVPTAFRYYLKQME
ncbi:MAG: A/G-specific adenine glycosylase [Oscillospiraceae bacterium]|nr:A/G-specific adenine glycosylase [Oscillospiraceae bacterium]